MAQFLSPSLSPSPSLPRKAQSRFQIRRFCSSSFWAESYWNINYSWNKTKRVGKLLIRNGMEFCWMLSKKMCGIYIFVEKKKKFLGCVSSTWFWSVVSIYGNTIVGNNFGPNRHHISLRDSAWKSNCVFTSVCACVCYVFRIHISREIITKSRVLCSGFKPNLIRRFNCGKSVIFISFAWRKITRYTSGWWFLFSFNEQAEKIFFTGYNDPIKCPETPKIHFFWFISFFFDSTFIAYSHVNKVTAGK